MSGATSEVPLLVRLYATHGFMAAGIAFGWSLMWLYWWKSGIPVPHMVLAHGSFFGVAALATVLFRSLPVRGAMVAGLLLRAGSLLGGVAALSMPLLLGLAAPLGVGLFLFWVPFNIAYFSRAPREHLALSLGLLGAVFPVLNAVLPAAAGGLAASAGFLPVFGVAALLMSLGVLPLRGVPGGRVRVDLKTALRIRARWLLLLEGGWQGVTFVAVPLFTIAFVDQPARYGLALSLFGLAGMAASLLLAWLSDRLHRRRGILLPVTLALGAATFLSGTSATLTQWEVWNSLASFAAALAPPFTIALVLESSRSTEDAVVARELFLNLGRFGGGVAMAVFLAAGGSVPAAIAGAGLLFLLYPLEVVRGGFYAKPQKGAATSP